jgi:serine phosphatase RsbU (regulator of sigma subunit)
MLWMGLGVLDLNFLFWRANNFPPGIPTYLGEAVLILFIGTLLIHFKYSTGKAESINFIDLLWKAFVTGLIATVISLLVKFFLMFIEGTRLSQNFIFINFFYHLNLGLSLVFVMTTWIIWKRLILYQKTKWLLRIWNIFEWLLYATLITLLFGLEPYGAVFVALYVLLIGTGLILAVNLKWVAYLNFGQKWKAILFIVLIVIYLAYFMQNFQRFNAGYIIYRDIFDNLFFIVVVSFLLIYAIFSVLVILFNLPTSSVFEQKLAEALTFQKLSTAIPSGEDEEQVYEVLLTSAMNAVNADAAWIEIIDHEKGKLLKTKNIDESKIEEISRVVHQSKTISLMKSGGLGEMEMVRIRKGLFRSAVVSPISIEKENVGELVLLKEVPEGFNRETGQIIAAFVNQASVNIENYRLIQSAIENERYREEVKIAKRVQESLLPDTLYDGEVFELAALSEAAADVGGDYYDIFRRPDGIIALIIADVSGKGTSAAFNMAQMKGVFHSLMQLDIDVDEFLVLANNALSGCLEATSFITATFFLINPKERKLSLARAGHSPSLFYSAEDKKANFFKNKGLGLGILRNEEYSKYVEKNEVNFNSGDVLTLYTDGIVEARNEAGDEFGYEKLRKLLCRYGDLGANEQKDNIIKEFYEFCANEKPDDDYTLLILKFL